jgi:hypothetical protein
MLHAGARLHCVNISLRLSDKSCVELPVILDFDEALSRLQEAVMGDTQVGASGCASGLPPVWFDAHSEVCTGCNGQLHQSK